MGGTYRSGLQARLRTDAVELSPTVPSRMPVFFPDADRFLDHPQGGVIVGDGRNYVRLSRETYDMIAVDPAPPIESAGSVVLYTHEFLTEGQARLRPGGVFMLWIPMPCPSTTSRSTSGPSPASSATSAWSSPRAGTCSCSAPTPRSSSRTTSARSSAIPPPCAT